MAPLLVLGSANADLYVEVERLPAPGETLPGGAAAIRPGGKGANQAAAAARLGHPTRFAGHLGDDAFAAPLRTALAGAGVELALLREVPGPTGQAFIILQAGGENSIILVGGANQTWSGGLDPAIAAAIPACGGLLLQGEIPEAVSLAAARLARAAGRPVVIDAGGFSAAPGRELLALASVFSPNETELARCTGMPTDDDAGILAAARAVQGLGAGTVLVKLGSRGALAVPAAGEPIRAPSFRVPVVDTTGAGDCFTAAYAVALLEGRGERDRLRFACAAAALCVQGKGAMPSMPDRARVAAFLAEHP